MPELPEVETIKQGLGILKGHKIVSVDVRVSKLFKGDEKELVDQKVHDIERRAKLLIWKLDNIFLLIHLKMTGQLIFIKQPLATSNQQLAKKARGQKLEADAVVGGHPDKKYNSPLPHKYTHIIIEFDHGTLYYNDLRKFGWMKLIKTEQKLKVETDEYGPEYDWPEYNSTYLLTKIDKYKNRTIKQILLDQTVVAGLGNIYSDEVLFCARINPKQKANNIDNKQISRLYECIPEVIKKALKHGGSSARDYKKVDGSEGTFLSVANVYKREKLPCNVCGTLIEKVKIGSRTSRSCPQCQK